MNAIRLARAALLGCAAVLVLSCGESTPLGVRPPQADVTTDVSTDFLRIGLVRCNPIPADEVTQTVGPDGGVINVGPHRLSIPAGALADSVSITAIAPSDTVNQVQFFPEGLVFARPARLTMSYANCRGLALGALKRIAHTTPDLLQILEFLLSLDNPFARRVSAQLPHFSTYAVAW